MISKYYSLHFVDEKFGLIKEVLPYPRYGGTPRIFFEIAYGHDYATYDFSASGVGITKEDAVNAAVGEYIERFSMLKPRSIEKTKESNFRGEYLFPNQDRYFISHKNLTGFR